jgi:hypothetical protein
VREALSAFFRGLGNLASIWPVTTVSERQSARSDLDALRSDTTRIGDDMRRAISRRIENETRITSIPKPSDQGVK